MSAAAERRREDLRRLRELCSRSAGRLRVDYTLGEPLQELAVPARTPEGTPAHHQQDPMRTELREDLRQRLQRTVPDDPPGRVPVGG